MEKINRYRKIQKVTLNDFLLDAVNNPSCKNCIYYNDCQELIGGNLEELMGGNGCGAFDNDFKSLTDIYVNRYVKI